MMFHVLTLWGLLVVSAIGALASVLYIIPRAERSRMRYKAWQTRDRVVDDLRAGILSDTRYARSFLEWLEAVIAHTRDLKLRYVRVVARSLTPAELDDRLKRKQKEWIDVPGDEQERFHTYERKINGALTRYLLAGSPYGWAVLPAIFIRVIRENGRDGAGGPPRSVGFHVMKDRVVEQLEHQREAAIRVPTDRDMTAAYV